MNRRRAATRATAAIKTARTKPAPARGAPCPDVALERPATSRYQIGESSVAGTPLRGSAPALTRLRDGASHHVGAGPRRGPYGGTHESRTNGDTSWAVDGDVGTMRGNNATPWSTLGTTPPSSPVTEGVSWSSTGSSGVGLSPCTTPSSATRSGS